MSVIEKMTIMGIRSFGPDDSDKQLIEFFKPLTLILGPNGSGKTTIIECLRYMTTGDPPPNTDRGGSFVHDPKIAGETEVKGQVKLQLKDVLNKRVVATRNMVVTQKQKKIQLKTLDGTITRYSANGDKVTLSSKCAEMDKELVTALGVSKAILTSVIFCHQEESNWPLSEGKILKQKFDEIFAATRYIKALDIIRKTRQEKVLDIKVFKAQVDNLKENRRKAAEFTESLEKTKSRLAACRDAVAELDNKLKPIMDKLQDISLKEHEIGRLNSSLESNSKLMTKLEEDEKDMRSVIKDLFEGKKEDLESEMDNFSALVRQKKKQLDMIKGKYLAVESEQRNLQKKQSKMQEDFGKLKAEQKGHEERIALRDAKLGNLGEQLGLGGASLDAGEIMKDSQVQNVLRNWKQKIAKTHQELKVTKTKYETSENNFQSQIDAVRDQRSQKEQTQKSCTEKIARNKETLRNIDVELSQVDSLANRQDDLKEDLTEAERELSALEKAVDVNALRGKISINQRHKKELELKLSSLNEEMSQLQKESKVRTEIDLISKDKSSKQEAVDRMLQRHRETIIHLIGNMPERNAQDNIKALVATLNQEIQSMNRDLDKNRSRVTKLQTSKSFLQQDLKKKEELLVSHKNKIFDVCGNENFDEGLDILQRTVKELQDQKGSVAGSLFLYNEYIEKLNSRKPCCPLCERSFQKNEEIENLKRDLQKKLQLVPNQLNKKEKLIAEHQKRLNSMLELRPLKQEILTISEKDIPEMKSKILKVDEDLEKTINEISDLEEILENKQCDSRTGTEMLPDLAMLDQSQRELSRLERRLSTLMCQLGSSDVTRTIFVVGDEQSAVQKEMDQIKSLIESHQLRISEHGEQVQRLRGQINDLRAEQVEISGRLQKKNALEEQLQVLAAENHEFTNLNKEIKTELTVLDKKILDLVAEKKKVIKDKETDLEKIRNKIISEEKQMEYIDGLTQEIERYVKAGKEKDLMMHENKISTIESAIRDKNNELLTLNKEKESLNKLISSHEIRYREFEDNLRLMKINEEIQSLKSECRKLKEKIGNFDIRTFLREKRQLGEQEKQLTKERNEHEGRQTELVKQVSLLQVQLQDKIYKDANKKHKEMIIKLRTTELTCDDMNKYYIALDRAVMNHHRMKMNEINKIIRDLWIKTYSGNDIDYIEIRSNEDDNEADLTKARRMYNYKVVWIKEETAVDMRGRCSAGQKVLASLIIRLALAETFCLNCGILALDEPTTNLDRDNISSLAKALVEIVKSRSEQRNFQLIIITHDEDFIELLGRSETVDYFYKVSKDANLSPKEKAIFSMGLRTVTIAISFLSLQQKAEAIRNDFDNLVHAQD